MSIKDLFKDQEGGKILSSKNLENLLGDGIESASYITEFEIDKERFVPTVDFSKPAKFARYGLAERYYTDTIKNIYDTFPYDGSLKEKLAWHNTGSYLQRFIFEKEYPRTNGFANIGKSLDVNASSINSNNWQNNNPEYILFKGGPNGPTGSFSFKDDKKLSKANVWHTGSNRDSNLKVDFSTRGNTIEFWLKKNNWAADHSSAGGNNLKEVIFDLWTSSSVDSSLKWDNGRLSIFLNSTNKSDFTIMCHSGSNAAHDNFETNLDSGLANIGDGKWHHYAFVFKQEDSKTKVKLYTDGVAKSELVSSKTFSQFNGNIAALGASVARSGTIGDLGWNTLSGSIDEFRFWKASRSAKEISRFWKFQVGGGTNTDTSNTNLGVYYKFNEGITGKSSRDQVVLDYSGRITNGVWYGYAAGSRNTGSAMVQSGKTTSEYKDPIIYSDHPSVSAYYDKKVAQGREWDYSNNASIFYTLPSWIIEGDTETSEGGSASLQKLVQIMASHFDTLQLQIDQIPKLKKLGYPSSSLGETFSDKPIGFADKLLQNYGFETKQLFSDIEDLERFYNRNESASFDLKLHDIKNFIYQNIYNNIVGIYKSKGTERSMRNLIRCFGVDDELIKINLYGDNQTYHFEDNYRTLSVDNRYVDFNDYIYKKPLEQEPFNATIHQHADAANPDAVNFISGTNIEAGEYLQGFAFSAEAEAIFPRKIQANKSLGQTPIVSPSSIFGMHQVHSTEPSAIKWKRNTTGAHDSANDHAQFRVYAVTDKENEEDAYFAVKLSSSIVLTSSVYADVYDNSKWNFSVAVHPEKSYTDFVSGSTGSAPGEGYKLQFYGINRELGTIVNEFLLTKSLSYDAGLKFVSAPKRMFAGAYRTDFTGSLLMGSDVKIGHCRAWLDHLPTASVKAHALDPRNFGRSFEYGNSFFGKSQMSSSQVRPIETLILNWDFEHVSSSAGDGTFYVKDFSSGSRNHLARYPDIFANIVDKVHDAKGRFFVTSSEKVVDKFYVPAARKQLPEIISSDEMIKVVNEDDKVFTRDTKPIQYFIALEKSMYQTVSEEMINFFETIQFFNNLIGDPVNRYRQDYKEMSKIRQLFFERVQNTPDIEKYLDYYKWFDSSITKMILNLVPASANVSDTMRNIIESHVLERNKYWNKFPTLEMGQEPPEAKIFGIKELLYNWKVGHASASVDAQSAHDDQDKNCLWFAERADRTDNVLSSGNTIVDNQRNSIRDVVTTENTASAPRLSTDEGATYNGSTYALRRLSRPYKFDVDKPLHYKGGSNKDTNILIGFHRQALKYADKTSYITFEKDLEIQEACKDNEDLVTKKRVIGTAEVYKNEISMESGSQIGYGNAKADLILPFSVYSSSLGEGGYATFVTASRIDITNIHEDRYFIGNEVPLQGPFTEKYVGGHQSRHIDLNYSSSIRGLDTESTRPEAWYLEQPVEGVGSNQNIFVEQFEGFEDRADFAFNSGFDNAPTLLSAEKVVSYGADVPSMGFGFYKQQSYYNSDGEFKQLTPLINDGMITTPHDLLDNLNNNVLYLSELGVETALKLNSMNVQYDHAKAQEFLVSTPTIDASNVPPGGALNIFFFYYMAGANPGILKVQHEKNGIYTDLVVHWDQGGTPTVGTQIVGNQAEEWRYARVPLTALGYQGSKFKIRFVNTGHPKFGSYLGGIVALDYISAGGFVIENSRMKLLDINHEDIKIKGVNIRRPRSVFYRSEFAKRPVNIKNIKLTASAETAGSVYKSRDIESEDEKGHQNLPTTIGNYEHNYQVVQTAGRNVNNLWFRSGSKGQGGVEDSLSNLNAVIGLQDYQLVDRGKMSDGTRTKTVIAERFSAPGDVATLSRGYLDRASETFSPYNCLVWRNWCNRRYLANFGSQSLLVRHSGKFGLRDGSSNISPGGKSSLEFYGDTDDVYFLTASYHKVQRNTGYRAGGWPADTDNEGDDVAPSLKNLLVNVQRDNPLVSRPIPRSDMQYNWIWKSNKIGPSKALETLIHPTSPLLPYTYAISKTAPFGHATGSSEIAFLSSSQLGSYKHGTLNIRLAGTSREIAEASNYAFIPDNFVGLNINIYDPVTASANTLGYFVKTLENYADSWPLAPQGAANFHAYATDLVKTVTVQNGPGQAGLLNSLLNHRNGPYGYPSWKQTRTADHPVARHQRRSNIINLTIEKDRQATKIEGKVKSKGNVIRSYKESPVTSKFKPLVKTIANEGPTGFFGTRGKEVSLVFTFGNNLIKFNNQALNNRLDLDELNFVDYGMSGRDVYETMREQNLLTDVRYSECLWPRGRHAYLNSTRKRDSYIEVEGLGANGIDRISHGTFWKDRHVRGDAGRRRTEGQARNSMGYLLSRFGAPKLPNGNHFLDYGPTDPMPFCDAVSVAQGARASLTVSASDNRGHGHGVLPFSNPCIGSTFMDIPLSAWPLDESKYGGMLETMAGIHGTDGDNQIFDLNGPTYKILKNDGTYNHGHYGLNSGSTHGMEFLSGTFGMGGELANDPSMNFLTSWASAYFACGTASWTHTRDQDGKKVRDLFNKDYTGMGGTNFAATETAISTLSAAFAIPYYQPATFNTMFRGGYRRPYASPTFFRDPYNNFNLVSTETAPINNKSQALELETDPSKPVVFGNLYNRGKSSNGQYTLSGNMSDFSGAFGYIKTAPYYRANKLAGKNPWYDSYEDYISDVRLIAQDQGVIPEFNLSQQIRAYESLGDLDNLPYEIANPGFLTLRGASISSSLLHEVGKQVEFTSGLLDPNIGGTIKTAVVLQNGMMNDQFLERYCKSDKMRYLNTKLSSDVAGGTPDEITVRFDAVTKLLPYYGFYPVTRTMQLATLFSQSISPFLSGSAGRLRGNPNEGPVDGGSNGRINKITYLGYHPVQKIAEDGDHATIAAPGSGDNRKGSKGTDFITASAHPTYIAGAVHEDGTPAGDTFAVEGLNISTRLFDLAKANVTGAIAWKKALIDVHKAGTMQAILQPTFAPGILYNTIKSGIAVDWPMYVNKHSPTVRTSQAVVGDPTGESGVSQVIPMLSSGSTLLSAPNFRLPFEAIYDLSRFPNRNHGTNDSDATDGGLSAQDEAFKMYYTEPTWPMCAPGNGDDLTAPQNLGITMAGSFWAAFNGSRAPFYEKAMQNFLSEIPNFFLQRRGLTKFRAAPSNEIKPFRRGKTYFMDVVMEVIEYPDRGKEFVMAEGPTQPLVPILSKRHEAAPLPRRGSIFGFPLRSCGLHIGKSFAGPDSLSTVRSGSTRDRYPTYNEGGVTKVPEDHQYRLFEHESDPQYAAYTPPYYYGKSKITLAYTHDLEPIEFIANEGNFDFNNPTRPNYSYIIENIQRNGRTKFDNALDRVLFFEPDGTAISASCLMFRGDPNNPPSLAYDNIMKLTSSMNLFNIKKVLDPETYEASQGIKKGRFSAMFGGNTNGGITPTIQPDTYADKGSEVWEISTKFECPVINVADSSYVNSKYHRPDMTSEIAQLQNSLDDPQKGYFGTRTGRSIWMGYSDTSNASEVTEKALTIGGNDSILPKRGIRISLSDTFIDYDQRPNSGSLLDHLGFRNNAKGNDEKLSKYVGEIAKDKLIEEALVTIPYVVTPIEGVTFKPFARYGIQDINFIRIHDEAYYQQYIRMVDGKSPRPLTEGELAQDPEQIKETSISKMMLNMANFVIPPELDFFHAGIKDNVIAGQYQATRTQFGQSQGEGLHPFIMYIMPFGRNLDSKDLGDIWQNLLPETGMKAEKDFAFINHELRTRNAKYEFFGRLDTMRDNSDIDVTTLTEDNEGKNRRTLTELFGAPDGKQNTNEVRWFTFKVKRRANMNMSQILSAKEVFGDGYATADHHKSRLSDRYSYNWPYDFFSLVETAKLTVELKMK